MKIERSGPLATGTTTRTSQVEERGGRRETEKEGERAHTRGRVTVEQEAQTAVPKSTRKSMREKHAHCQSCLAILSCTHSNMRHKAKRAPYGARHRRQWSLSPGI